MFLFFVYVFCVYKIGGEILFYDFHENITNNMNEWQWIIYDETTETHENKVIKGTQIIFKCQILLSKDNEIFSESS